MTVADSPAALAQQCELIILSVSADEDVLAMIEALIPGLQPGSVVLDTSTVSRETAKQAAQMLAAIDVAFLDAPVSGGIEGAQKGTLAMMIGGDAEVLQAHPAGTGVHRRAGCAHGPGRAVDRRPRRSTR